MPRSFYDRDPRVVGPELLGKALVHGDRAVRIVEVEAYVGADDPASHAYRGRTPRTRVMFGPPGHLYVYFSYGMHWCANAVCGPEGEAAAVLLRAGEALAGLEAMRHDRSAARRDRDLANGPAKLCQALGIDGDHDGADLVDGTGPTILDDGVPPPPSPATSGRVGISVAVEHPWRWFVPDDPHVSPGRPGPAVGRRGR
nr:DNA-3-methyladenine glycosylase [Rhabdothermincola salaria]